MQEKTARERVLKNVRKALIQREQEQGQPQIDLESEIYYREEEDLTVLFAEEFVRNDGRFVYCQDKNDFLEQFLALVEHNQWQYLVCFEEKIDQLFSPAQYSFLRESMNYETVQVGISSCEALVARVGGIMITSAGNKSRMLSVFPPVHIVVAFANQLVYDIKDAIDLVKKRYNGDFPSMTTLVAGPSRTADIEKTLVLGAHGPKEIYLFLIDEE